MLFDLNAQSGGTIKAHAGGDRRTGESVMSDELSAYLLLRIRIGVYASFVKRGRRHAGLTAKSPNRPSNLDL